MDDPIRAKLDELEQDVLHNRWDVTADDGASVSGPKLSSALRAVLDLCDRPAAPGHPNAVSWPGDTSDPTPQTRTSW